MIDRETVQRIKDAANIVEVVSEFVTLRKSGSGYKGLCPFHNERTPSFHVSPARGICHCFGCGKGGDSVSFIMEHEQMTYPEALRWLANKYHIEIKERELSDEEKQEQSTRESMFIVNEWAADYFHDLLKNHADGKAVGMQYFRSRGFRDDIIEKFRLGFDLNDRNAFATAALQKGYKAEFIEKVGICYKNEHGQLIDRYSGRVIFPWIGVNGKVVAFGGRVLDSRTKGVNQKYVNSPESEIFHKDHELYGIYQAKRAIAKEDHVFMVEGYTDVISMHQCGIENVVANSGTALSIHQIHTLHRFTSNITLLYDGDEAGVHAALRGTDMLLAEGMNLKVLLLPDNDDPDSFARKHTAEEFRSYVEQHQTDFIEFKTKLLLNGVADPIKRSEAVNSILRSVAMVHDNILRATYIHDCSQRLSIAEATLINTVNQFISETRTQEQRAYERKQNREDVQGPMAPRVAKQDTDVETLIAQMIVRHGSEVIIEEAEDEQGNIVSMNVAQYIGYNLGTDGLTFQTDIYNRMLNEALEQSEASADFDSADFFLHHHDIEISQKANALFVDNYMLTGKTVTEEPNDDSRQREKDAMLRKIDHLLTDFRLKLLEDKLSDIEAQIKAKADDAEAVRPLLEEYNKIRNFRNQFANQLGSNVLV